MDYERNPPIILTSKKCVLEVLDRLIDSIEVCSDLLEYYEKSKLPKSEKLEFRDEVGSLAAYCWEKLLNIQINCNFPELSFDNSRAEKEIAKWKKILRPNPNFYWFQVVTTEIPFEGKPYICSDKKIAVHVLNQLDKISRYSDQISRIVRRRVSEKEWKKLTDFTFEMGVFCIAIKNTFYFDHPDLIEHQVFKDMMNDELESIEKLKLRSKEPQMIALFRHAVGLEKFDKPGHD